MKKIELTITRSTGIEAASLALQSFGFTSFQAVRWLRAIETVNSDGHSFAEVRYEFWIHLREMLTVIIEVRLERNCFADGTEWFPTSAKGYTTLPEDGQCLWRFHAASDALVIVSSDTESAKKWEWLK